MQPDIKKEKNKLFIWLSLAVILLLIAADQLTKMLVVKNMSLEGQIEIIPGLLDFKYVRNTGISFGLFSGLGMQIALSAVTVLIVAVILWFLWFKKPSSRLLKCALILVASGGVGNAIDRIRLGYVIDFLLFEFDWFPYVFNVADCFVTVGGAMFCIYLIFGFGATESKTKRARNDGSSVSCEPGSVDNAVGENTASTFAEENTADDIKAEALSELCERADAADSAGNPGKGDTFGEFSDAENAPEKNRDLSEDIGGN